MRKTSCIMRNANTATTAGRCKMQGVIWKGPVKAARTGVAGATATTITIATERDRAIFFYKKPVRPGQAFSFTNTEVVSQFEFAGYGATAMAGGISDARMVA